MNETRLTMLYGNLEQFFGKKRYTFRQDISKDQLCIQRTTNDYIFFVFLVYEIRQLENWKAFVTFKG